jgi:peroxiredoxin
VSGAEISLLKFVDSNSNQVYETKDTLESGAPERFFSDANGRLELPPLPADAKFSVTIAHPDWHNFELEDRVATSGLISSVTMQTGVRVVLDFKIRGADAQALEGRPAGITLLSQHHPSRHPTSVMHSFPIRDGKVQFTAGSIEYSTLRVEVEGFCIEPKENYPWDVAAQRAQNLNLSSGDSKQIDLLVKRKVRARGRVINSDGSPRANNAVYGLVRLAPEPENTTELSDAEKQAQRRNGWVYSGEGVSNDKGEYEIELAPGKSRVYVREDGYFTVEGAQDLEVAADGSTVIPDIKLQPLPTLQGRLLDPKGDLVREGLVLLSPYLCADPVGVSGGAFSQQLTNVRQSSDGSGVETKVRLYALDPKSDLGGSAVVDISDQDSLSNIVINISSQPVDWMEQIVEAHALANEGDASARKKQFADQRKLYAQGVEGELPPSLAEGTWLNTDANSLADFRGKYVLLDFWFIGCGPCQQDMPTVKLAQKYFSELGFTVVSVHTNSQTPADVRQFAEKHEMNYPIVVDNSNGDIVNQYRHLGLTGYPYYLLVGPDGRIVRNDELTYGASLRVYKLELIYTALRREMARGK